MNYEEKYIKFAFKKAKHFWLVSVTIVVGNYFRERMTAKQKQTQKQNKNEEWAQVTVYVFIRK